MNFNSPFSSLLLAAGMLISGNGFAESIAVFAKGEVLVLESSASQPAPADPKKSAFLTAFKADLVHPQPFGASVALSDLPQWGRKVPGAAGTIQYHPAFRGGFVVRVALQGLTPSHRYILTLNGNPERSGNDQLPELVPHNEKEKYFDFLTVATDAKGSYEATFGILLTAGAYDLRFYVKDTDDFKIILYRDFFMFRVE